MVEEGRGGVEWVDRKYPAFGPLIRRVIDVIGDPFVGVCVFFGFPPNWVELGHPKKKVTPDTRKASRTREPGHWWG